MAVVQRGTAYQQSLDWLRERIESGDWAIGDRIPTEPALMAELGVGRNTVREAIKTLTSTGILEIRRGSGTFVRARTDIGGLLGRSVDPAELLHAFEVRRALELEAIALACERRTDADLARMRAGLAGRDAADADETAFTDHDLDFHLAIVAAAHNPVLSDLIGALLEPMRATYAFTEGVHSHDLAADQHRAALDAVEARDPVAAVAAARGYLALTLAAVRTRAADRR
ncbi:FadR/GntR family transcriptional regulator [Rhodococcus sp. NPDC003318]|uniref:FadR/GntR family transcriptional regulator n=1 Tax=Rhodococcus sp. NPDC003318 TaxID=3364503 RepID=UPI0036AEEDCF